MPVKSPVVTFGLAAKAAALRARGGAVPLQQRVELATIALRTVPTDEEARRAVLDFLALVQADPIGAGVAFDRFVENWTAVHVPPASPQQPVFDWQERADLQ